MEKLSSMKPVPGAKKVGDRWLKLFWCRADKWSLSTRAAIGILVAHTPSTELPLDHKRWQLPRLQRSLLYWNLGHYLGRVKVWKAHLEEKYAALIGRMDWLTLQGISSSSLSNLPWMRIHKNNPTLTQTGNQSPSGTCTLIVFNLLCHWKAKMLNP